MGPTTRPERILLATVRVVVAVTGVALLVFAPVTAFLTLFGAVTGIEGARMAGVPLPVRVETPAPPGITPPGGWRLAVDSPGSLSAGALPFPSALVCTVLWLVAVVLTVLAMLRLYRISRGLTRSSRLERGAAGEVRVLAGWTVAAGLAWTVARAVGSVLGASWLGDPRVRADVDLMPALVGLGLAALLVVLTVVLRTATALQDEQDLTV